MIKNNKYIKKKENLGKSLFIAFLILISHVVLITAMGLLILFFRGIIHYMTWIFIGGSVIIIGSAFYFIRKIKQKQHDIFKILSLPEFSDKDIEVRLLGGAASFKIGNKTSSPAQIQSQNDQRQLENPLNPRLNQLEKLSGLYKEKLITENEYLELKKELLDNNHMTQDNSTSIDYLDIKHSTKDYPENSNKKMGE
ncbi:MAG: hypothetical protein CSB21_02820 [Deltaproteobacteria bacterium]|nr:MAG: hypothetical protein CSB21_02820 [Deltaproteobacteria bacterium]